MHEVRWLGDRVFPLLDADAADEDCGDSDIHEKVMQVMEDRRPKWLYKLPESLVRWLINHNVVEVQLLPRTKCALRLKAENGDFVEVTFDFFHNNAIFRLEPGFGSLVQVYRGSAIRSHLDDIDRWEQRNRCERAEYERLKKKFG